MHTTLYRIVLLVANPLLFMILIRDIEVWATSLKIYILMFLSQNELKHSRSECCEAN